MERYSQQLQNFGNDDWCSRYSDFRYSDFHVGILRKNLERMLLFQCPNLTISDISIEFLKERPERMSPSQFLDILIFQVFWYRHQDFSKSLKRMSLDRFSDILILASCMLDRPIGGEMKSMLTDWGSMLFWVFKLGEEGFMPECLLTVRWRMRSIRAVGFGRVDEWFLAYQAVD